MSGSEATVPALAVGFAAAPHPKTYKAAYQFVDGGVHRMSWISPGQSPAGPTLSRRAVLASALLDLAELCLERGEPLPIPDPSVSDPDADIEEPLHLHLKASTAVELVPTGVIVP